MKKNKPVGSKLLNKLWQDIDHQMHHQRLKEIRSTKDNFMSEPNQMPHLAQNGK